MLQQKGPIILWLDIRFKLTYAKFNLQAVYVYVYQDLHDLMIVCPYLLYNSRVFV